MYLIVVVFDIYILCKSDEQCYFKNHMVCINYNAKII